MRRHLMSTMQKRNRLQTAMKLTSTANEVGFDAQRNRLRFFATSYSYSKHFIYAFNGRTKKIPFPFFEGGVREIGL